jgi:hypothetical protein
MSDEFDSLFERLRGQQPPRAFAVPEAVRRRGRQRSQHQALAAGLAVVALAGGGSAGVATGVVSIDDWFPPEPTAAPTVSRSPSPVPTRTLPSSPAPSGTPGPSATTTRPDPGDLSSRMLRPEDLGPGAWQRRQPYEPFSGDTWAWDLSTECPAYHSADYPSLRQQVAVETDGWATGASAPYVYEHVHLYRPGAGPQALDDVGRVLATCPGGTPPPTTPGGPVPSRFTVLDTDFAGDESLLVRHEAWQYINDTAIEPYATLIAVVRVGDLVATVMFAPEHDAQYARAVAAAAAQRLAGG